LKKNKTTAAKKTVIFHTTNVYCKTMNLFFGSVTFTIIASNRTMMDLSSLDTC